MQQSNDCSNAKANTHLRIHDAAQAQADAAARLTGLRAIRAEHAVSSQQRGAVRLSRPFQERRQVGAHDLLLPLQHKLDVQARRC
jgi:hypothetical protein